MKIKMPPKAALIPLVLAVLAFVYEVIAPEGDKDAAKNIAKNKPN